VNPGPRAQRSSGLATRPQGQADWWGAGMVICLRQSADLHIAQLIGFTCRSISSSKILLLTYIYIFFKHSKMICIWSSLCYCHPIISCCIKIQMAYLSGAGLPRLPWKRDC